MNQIKSIEGPIFEPTSKNKPKQLVVLCHGLGSDGNDLIGLAPYFAKTLPDAIFMSPNAPFPFDMAPSGYQWFSLENSTPESRLLGVKEAAPILNNFIDLKLAELGLAESQLALVGFSQGAMLGLYAGLRRENEIAGIIGYSGGLIGEECLKEEINSRPPVLLVHGDTDEVVPPDALENSVKALAKVGVEVNGELRPGLGHTLDERGIMLGMDFLAHCFGVSVPNQS